MTNYSPEPVPQTAGSAELQEYLMREFSRISAALEVADAVTLPNITTPPDRPEEGTIIYADGTTFNPGQGEGLYVYKNGVWVKLENDNIAGGQFSFRNKIINGDFDIWQRGTSQTLNGYGSDDRWLNAHNGDTKTHSQQAFTVGQTDVPGNPRYFSRTTGSTVAGAGNYVIKLHRIEGVRTLAGELATLTFWAKADFNRQMAIEFIQLFGTGGAPSAQVDGSTNGLTEKVSLTTSWQKFSYTVQIPSIAGKTIGTNNDDNLSIFFWMDAGADWNSRTDSLGQNGGGWFYDLAQVSLVKGDATTEDNPSSPLHIGQKLLLCQRYYYKPSHRIICAGAYADIAARTNYETIYFPTTMRGLPTVTFTNSSVSNSVALTTNLISLEGHEVYSQSLAAGPFYALANVAYDAEL